MVILFWVVVSAGTIREVYRGHVFNVPYLEDLFPEDDGNGSIDLETVSGSTC